MKLELLDIDEKGKGRPYKFKSKEEKDMHYEACLNAFGSLPIDVNWTKNNPIFKEKLKELMGV